MVTYKVKVYFGLEFERITVFFNTNTKWQYCGEYNGYIRLERQGVFVDVTKEQLERYFVEENK